MKTVKCICSWCKKEFDKPLSEFKRSTKKNQPHFCSLNCSASNRNKNRQLTPRMLKQLREMAEKSVGTNRDDYTPFRYFKRKQTTHKYQKDVLSLEDIKKVWDRQNGICEHTGFVLSLPNSIMGFDDTIPPHKRASLDRIDNTKGYTKDNIHFVSFMSNMAKNRFDEKCVLDFIQAIRAQ